MRTTIAAQNDILTTQLSAIDATLVENPAHGAMHTDHFYNISDNQRHWGSLLLKRLAENSGLELEALNRIIEGLATNSRLQLEAHRHFGNRLVERLAENSGLELEAHRHLGDWLVERLAKNSGLELEAQNTHTQLPNRACSDPAMTLAMWRCVAGTWLSIACSITYDTVLCNARLIRLLWVAY
jgi:hypothetical protein